MTKPIIFTKNLKKISTNGNFTTFQHTLQSQKLNYDIIDGLYQKTIFNRIVSRFISASIPSFFNVVVENIEGERVPELEKLLIPLNEKVTRRNLKEILRSLLLYGTSVTYIGGESEESRLPVSLFNIHPKEITPQLDLDESSSTYGELIAWEYNYKGENVYIPPEDLMILANNPEFDKIFGHSILEPMLDTLNHLLNVAGDVVEVVDNYAIPILKWSIETVNENGMIDDDMIDKVRQQIISQFSVGDDVITDARVTADPIGFGKDQVDLPKLLEEARRMLSILSIPFSLLGDKSDNLSSIKVQALTFNSDCISFQADVNDGLVERVYKPYLNSEIEESNETIDFANIYINFIPPTLEMNSDAVIWLKWALESGIISEDEARSRIGYRGKAPGLSEQMKEIIESQSGGKKEGEEPKNRDGRSPDNESNSLITKVVELANEGYAKDVLHGIVDLGYKEAF